MKFSHLLLFLLPILGSCSQNAKHPQADLINSNIPAAMTEESIVHFADSIDANLNTLEKRSSLVYHLEETSLYIEKYTMNGIPVLYKTFSDNEGISSVVSNFYFNNDSLILVRENKKQRKQNTEVLDEVRTFFRNNIAFRKEIRTGLASSNLKDKQFSPLKHINLSMDNYASNIKTFNDAIEGNEKFDLVFDSFMSAPNERYILLKSRIPNGYNANILVTQNDQFIDSLIAEPMLFKDEKLNIKWEIKNREAVYVPVADSVTSAKGLNR
ncbi:MAG: hypothetical protein EOO88_17055 [Pedobacter sp.]|nr:MAG: hypothetical protein EOO88_17055 [Pedobacter sp.]